MSINTTNLLILKLSKRLCSRNIHLPAFSRQSYKKTMKNQRISRKWNTLRLKKGYVTIQIFTNAPAKEKKKAIGWNASLALKGTTFGACISKKA